MMRVFSRVFLTIATVSLLIRSGVAGESGGTASAQKADSPNAAVKITLYPAAAPVPALKYQLLPPFLERRPGNAALHYLKTPCEGESLFGDGEFWDTACKWAEMPLPELRKARDADQRTQEKRFLWLGNGNPGWMLGEIERGARRESCDWDIPIREHEFFSILLPEVQSMRALARMLVVRARLQVADGKFDQAVRTFQTGYSFGRHVGQPVDCLVQCLVGATIVGMTSAQVETFIQQLDAPNLYWALATLPRPMVDFRHAFEVERNAIYLSYPELRDLDKKTLSPEEWRQLLEKTVDHVVEFFPRNDESSPQHSASPEAMRLKISRAVTDGYPRAKQFLIAHGRPASEVAAMPAAQVVLLYTMQTYDELSDQMFRWTFLPYPTASKGLHQAETRYHEVAVSREIIPVFQAFMWAVPSAKTAEALCDRQIAILSILEAIRIYGASHDGRLPEKLSDITEVPIPNDPMRGEPFSYRREGDKAILESLGSPLSLPGSTVLRYQIEMKRKENKPPK